MKWNKILILTFKPLSEIPGKDLESHLDFKDWQFISRNSHFRSIDDINQNKPYVCFASFQNFLGKTKSEE